MERPPLGGLFRPERQSRPESATGSELGGRQLRSIAPLLVSASRKTDLPAFHAPWFMNRLRQGYCLWHNPFNAAQRRLVSFARCKAFVFWSKNPSPLIEFLPEIRRKGHEFYFQFTLNDYENEGLERNLAPLPERIAVFKKLSLQIGAERVIWRFDPIIMGAGLTPARLLDRVENIARQLCGHTEKLIFSFLDMYKKTERNLNRLDPHLRPPAKEEICQIAGGLAEIRAALPSALELRACSEAEDLRRFGIYPAKCVDFGLLRRICPGLENAPRNGMGQGALLAPMPAKQPRDRGQRQLCGCYPATDIGRYNTCPHLCSYCYANYDEKAVARGMARANVHGEAL